MTDMTTTLSNAGGSSREHAGSRRFKLTETQWGYTVLTTAGAARGLIIAQTISMLLGAAFLAAAIGMWLLPLVAIDDGIIRMFVTVVFASLAILFLWYGSRGVLSQIHVDTNRGEIREVTRARSGKLSVIGCYGFDTVGAIAIEPADTVDEVDLVLHYRNGGDALIIATGQEADLIPLRERIKSDVVVGSNAATA